jgi:hypothetical protein
MKNLFILLLIALFSGCARGNADAVHAETIPSDDLSVKCFAIRDNDGNVKAGGCVKN